MSSGIFTGVCLGICAIVMFGIGFTQLRSKKPVAFYSGEKPPDEKDLTDVSAWNKKHGWMWVLYGIWIILMWVCGLLIGNGPLLLLPMVLGILLPIPFMVWYHHRLVRIYLVQNVG